jgi:MFS family permease
MTHEVASSRPTRYLDVPRSRWGLVSVATLLYWTGAHALRPLLPLRLDALGASEAVVGFVVALFPLSSLGLAIPSGRLVDRIGVQRMLAAGFVGMAITGAGFALSGSTATVALLTAAIGLTELATWIALQSLASAAGTGEFLTKQLALFSLAWGVGLAGGPMIGAVVYDRFGFAQVGILYLACGAAGSLCIWFAPRVAIGARGGVAPIRARDGVRSMWASAPIRATLLSSFVVLFLLGVKGSFLPLYLERAGLSIPRIGVVLSAMGVAALVIRIPLPWLLRRYGAAPTLVASMWLALVPMTMMPAVRGFGLWLTLGIVCGLGLGINPPVTVELMAQHTDTSVRGLAMGLRLTANRVAQIIQPVVFGAVIGAAGFGAAFALSGGALAAVTGWIHRLRRQMARSGTAAGA